MSNSATLGTVDCQAPLSMEFSRSEYWSGLPFLSPGNLSSPGIERVSPALQADYLPLRVSPALQADYLPFEPPGKPRSSIAVQYVTKLGIKIRRGSSNHKGLKDAKKGGRRKRAVPVTLNNFVKIRMFSDQTLSKKIIIFGNMTCSC